MALGPNYRKLFAATTISNLGDGVGLIAYPWLASAITRNPLLIALVAVAQRLPWLRVHAAGRRDHRPRRPPPADGRRQRRPLRAHGRRRRRRVRPPRRPAGARRGRPGRRHRVVAVPACCSSPRCCSASGEVLYDNSAQTFMPALVDDRGLERANGRLYSAELVANQFVGPPLAGLLLAVGFALPFVVDAGTFAASAGLVFSIAATGDTGARRCRRAAAWRAEIAEGFRWLWHHPAAHDGHRARRAQPARQRELRRDRALGQEVLGTSTTEFAILAAAAGDRRRARRLGGARRSPSASAPGRRWASTLWGGGLARSPSAFVSSWPWSPGCSLRDDVLRRAVERDHGELAPGGDPRSPARPGQQRLPLLRVGGDPDRRADRRGLVAVLDGRSSRERRCGCRGSSPGSPTLALTRWCGR